MLIKYTFSVATMKAIFKFFLISLLKLPLLLTVPFAAVIVPLFYRAQDPELKLYTWGGQYGTFDNPPQGDRGFISKHAPFRNVTTGFKGYINRAAWMWRNPLYGFNKSFGVGYDVNDELKIRGNPNISDKYKIAGWMFATLRDNRGRLKAFEWYSVTPWCKTRDLRIRVGWKIKTDKMQERGWARHVVTINPFDGYG